MSLINFRSVIYEKYCCVYSNVNGGQLQNLFNSLHKLEKPSYVLFIRELPSVSQFSFLSHNPILRTYHCSRILQKFSKNFAKIPNTPLYPNFHQTYSKGSKNENFIHSNFFQPSTLQNSLVKQPKSGRSTQQTLKESIGGANDPRAKW